MRPQLIAFSRVLYNQARRRKKRSGKYRAMMEELWGNLSLFILNIMSYISHYLRIDKLKLALIFNSELCTIACQFILYENVLFIDRF